jgi:hypothetical protein
VVANQAVAPGCLLNRGSQVGRHGGPEGDQTVAWADNDRPRAAVFIGRRIDQSTNLVLKRCDSQLRSSVFRVFIPRNQTFLKLPLSKLKEKIRFVIRPAVWYRLGVPNPQVVMVIPFARGHLKKIGHLRRSKSQSRTLGQHEFSLLYPHTMKGIVGDEKVAIEIGEIDQG